ncbi:MAG: DUF222 domain-containing protein [Trebonia sp.]
MADNLIPDPGVESDAGYDWREDEEVPADPVPGGDGAIPSVWLGEPVAATPDDLAGRGFREGGLADTLAPGAALVVLADSAADNSGGLDDNERLGAVSAARRLAARAEWLELRQVAAFSRHQDALYEASVNRGDRALHREGEFGVEELAFQLRISRQSARAKVDFARNLDDRLPNVSAGLRDGLITKEQVRHIHRFTSCLNDEKAAAADKILAAAAPGLSDNAAAYRARKVCYNLDPELFDRMREEGARKNQRLEVAQEDSGNAKVMMREMSVADAAAVKAGVDAEAARLKNAGLEAPLRQIRFWIARDRALGLDPWDRLAPVPEPPPDDDACEPPPDNADTGTADVGFPGVPARGDAVDPAAGIPDGPTGDTGDAGPFLAWDGTDVGQFPADDGYREDEDEGRPGGKPASGGRGAAPLPGLITLVVTDKTLFGWSDQLGEAGGWGLVAPGQMREFVEAASLDPRTRWCVTLVDDGGEAIAHGCARGRHPWTAPAANDHVGTGADRPAVQQKARLYDLLRSLNVTLEPIAKGTCDHRHEEEQYIASRKLKHLTRARSATCPAPGCGSSAIHNEIDHTEPWPGGKTDECNLSGPCPRHHHAKHAPGWSLQQSEPGVMKWQTPSGRTFTTRPTRYDL